MSTRNKAHELANEFLKEPIPANQASQTPQRFAFRVLDANGKETGETVEINVAIKSTGLRKSAAMARHVELSTTISQFSPGRPCPTCGGSGSL